MSQLEQQTDERLIQRIAGGSETAFTELYRRYGHGLYNYLLRLVGDAGAAEDLLQDLFLSVWQKAGHFRQEAQVKTWLYRIAYRRAASWLRRRKPSLPLTSARHQAGPHNPEESVNNNQRHDCLRQQLNHLSPDHRTVVELAFFQGMSYEEIAVVMDCPAGTVKSRMNYARRRLKRLLLAVDERSG